MPHWYSCMRADKFDRVWTLSILTNAIQYIKLESAHIFSCPVGDNFMPVPKHALKVTRHSSKVEAKQSWLWLLLGSVTSLHVCALA